MVRLRGSEHTRWPCGIYPALLSLLSIQHVRFVHSHQRSRERPRVSPSLGVALSRGKDSSEGIKCSPKYCTLTHGFTCVRVSVSVLVKGTGLATMETNILPLIPTRPALAIQTSPLHTTPDSNRSASELASSCTGDCASSGSEMREAACASLVLRLQGPLCPLAQVRLPQFMPL